MAMSNNGVYFFIITGIITLVLSALSFVCAIIEMSALSTATEVSLGFTALYFIAPGLLCIISGRKQGYAVLGAGLALNIVGIVLGFLSLVSSSILWSYRRKGGKCSNYFAYEESNCSEKEGLIGTITIIYALLFVLCFAGSIYGCTLLCWTEQNYFLMSNEPGQVNDMTMNSITATNSGVNVQQDELSQQTSQDTCQPPPYVHSEASVQFVGNIKTEAI